MSSHHIVKEKQEPALYIHQLGSFSEEALGQLLEWSPTILVSAAEFEKIVSMGIKVDLVAGRLPAESLQEHTVLLNKGTESPEAVLNYLLEQQYPAVNIISEEVIWDLLAGFAGKINIVWFTPGKRTYPVKSGFSVWKPAGTIFSLNEEKMEDMINLKQVKTGVYEVEADGFVTFRFKGKELCINEHL